MPRIHPVDPATAEEKTQELLKGVQAQIGMVPNLMKTLGHSPAALEGYLNFNTALSQGVLCPKLREKIAVAMAGLNQCGYCASAHTAIGKNAGVEAAELKKNLQSESQDPQSQAALLFVNFVVNSRGQISDAELNPLRDAGFSDAEIVEIVGHIGLNIFTNYFNNVSGTSIDFPVVDITNTCAA